MMCPVPVELIDSVIAAYLPTPTKPRAAQTVSSAKNGRRNRRDGRSNPVARCRKYLKAVPPAVEGQGGSDQTFKVARIIWNDFGLDEADGWPLFCEWNRACQPPWPEEHADGGKQCLRRKWDEAVARGPGHEGRGHRVENSGRYSQVATTATSEALQPPIEPVTAPDSAGAGGDADPELSDNDSTFGSPLPGIIHNQRQYREVQCDALSALVAANNPPFVFVGNGDFLVELRKSDPLQPPRARVLKAASLRSIFANVANWQKWESDGDGGQIPVEDYPPPALLSTFPALGSWPGIPRLTSIVPYPVYTPNWELLDKSGHHAESGIYCHVDGLELPDVPKVPTSDAVVKAKELILTELLGDFPFVDQASRANAVAMLLLPFVRHAIDGPTPLGVADAPVEGTGKSLLIEAMMFITLGAIPEAITADLKEEERDKILLALLLEGQPIIYFDNANRSLDSASFASTLTARFKRGRILGETRTAHALVNVCWHMAGNNFTCSREMARRLYLSRIDSGVETPSERKNFRHPDLLEWVRVNRGQLIWASLVLIQNWRACGAVPGSRDLGKFERWSRTIGGILAAAGIDGFLENADAFRKQCADTVGELAEFVKGWWDRFGSRPTIAGSLFDLATDSLESVLDATTVEGKRRQLGRYLKANRDRVVGKHRIKIATKDDGSQDMDHSGRLQFWLEEIR